MMKYITTVNDLLGMFGLHQQLCKHKGCRSLDFEDFTLVFIQSNYTDIQANAFRKLTKLVKNDD